MGRFSDGWQLTKQSVRVLRADRSLAWFPLLAGLAVLVVTAVAVGVAVVFDPALTDSGEDHLNPVTYVVLIVLAYLCTFITVFSNVGLAACADRSLRGQATGVGEGIGAALQRVGQILGWVAVAGTVGVLLGLARERTDGGASRVAESIAGAAWAVASFFVIPLIALEGLGPWAALRKSVSVVRQRWGEGATGTVVIAVVNRIIMVVLVLVGVVAVVLLLQSGSPTATVAAFGVGTIAVVLVALVAVVTSAITGVFRVAVYQFATTGRAPAGFDSASLAHAVRH